ncbi:5-hydroxytryptamine receptor 3E-like [Xiphophorus maculatus]|uniref:5-hydroxytryptamine receptor 3E-like n=1 Tax=Xiphophorus maculatus TaxID=8083 RepID=UPI000C6ED6F9|nr:5-hydroxytryptamine receptor 3E-like [Xiphophorus maculatus]
MILAGFFTLFLLTDGNTSSLQQLEDLPGSSRTFDKMSGGNTSDPEVYPPPSTIPDIGGNTSDPNPDEYLVLMAANIDISLMEYPSTENMKLVFEQIREHEVHSPEECSTRAVLNHLNLTQDSDKYTVGRPVKHQSHLTWVLLDMRIYAILDVRESDQTFIAYIWIYLRWDNEHIWWDPEQFCGTTHILVPTKYLWMPDMTIEEMTEQDKASPSPNLNIRNYGWVEFRNDQVVISTCRMRVYKFPFDVQSCNISFKSIMYSDEEIKLFYYKNNSEISEWSRKAMETQYEWLFVSMTVTSKTVNHFGFNQTMIVYTINMKRRSVLYIANFLLPVFFFLCLDFASLLMSDTGGEKVGFKITILLAVTVMQLILNDILPSSSDKIPLIAVYCIGTFALMLLSLLETILVIHLINRDAWQDNDQEKTKDPIEGQEEKLTNSHTCFIGIKNCSNCASVNKNSANRRLSIGKEGNKGGVTEVSIALEKMSDELGEIKKSITLLSGRQAEDKVGYWTRTVQKINKTFAVFYVTAVVLFLLFVSIMWYSADE